LSEAKLHAALTDAESNPFEEIIVGHDGELKHYAGNSFFGAGVERTKGNFSAIGEHIYIKRLREATSMKSRDKMARSKAINYFTLWELMDRKTSEVDQAWQSLSAKLDLYDRLPANVGVLIGRPDITEARLNAMYARVQAAINCLSPTDWVISKSDIEYPEQLRRVEGAPEFLFVRGENLDILTKPIISIVGARKASEEGRLRAFKLAGLLAGYGIVVASGLAYGIDRAAHEGALAAGGDTIAVLGTPLNRVYPKEHEELQNQIGRSGLLVSQFYPGAGVQRFYFPMRNAVMSGLSLATVVIEARETSGSLIQARQCLKQGRKLFIPQSAVDNPNLEWPKRFLKNPGAFSFSRIEDLMEVLKQEGLINESAKSGDLKVYVEVKQKP